MVQKFLSVALHTSGTISHVTIIYGTHFKMLISSIFFPFFWKFWLSESIGGKMTKNGPEWQNILSVALHISGTIHHMVIIYGAYV